MEESFSLIHTPEGLRLQVIGEATRGFHGVEVEPEVWHCPLDSSNAAALRQIFPWTAPAVVGLRRSIGCGDRLGLATPGHILAVRGSGLFPVLAQQSMREMICAGRAPRDVIDDATWAVFAADYRDGYGSDANHLRSVEAIDLCVEAGFHGFTLDPGGWIDDSTDTDPLRILRPKYQALPWEALQATPLETRERYGGGSMVGFVTDEMIYRAACKYGQAVVEIARLARHLAARMGGRPYDVEVALDAARTPTSPFDHYFVASELGRLGVTFQGVAPRFAGRFEEAIDFDGDLESFEVDFARHVRLAQRLGPYKVSVHAGSDKFSIYPLLARYEGFVHIKTSGTSWLEALRIVAQQNPPLMRAVLAVALLAYEQDRRFSRVSARITRVPVDLPDDRLPDLLDYPDARQVLHVTFGSVLTEYREALLAVLRAHQDAYTRGLSAHFERHILPFKEVAAGQGVT